MKKSIDSGSHADRASIGKKKTIKRVYAMLLCNEMFLL